mgnify:FL=1
MGHKRTIMKIEELSKIERAKDIAQLVHAGQYRKISKQPYIQHPFRVYQRARAMGLSNEIQIVAILHDTYEDARNKEYVANQIKMRFGSTIFKYILLLSHDKNVEYNKYLLSLANKSNIALTVKLLDMIENLLDNPSQKQKEKYLSGLLYLLNNKVKIDSKLVSYIKKLTQ